LFFFHFTTNTNVKVPLGALSARNSAFLLSTEYPTRFG
jgi:hypothetical protein